MISWSDAWRWGARQLNMAGIESSSAEAHQLLKDRIGAVSPALSRPDEPMSSSRWLRYTADITRRTRREPMQYIRGEVEFYSVLFHIDERALIPRPETELLVDEVSRLLPELPPGPVLDLCTGSGVVAICLALRHPDRGTVGVDIDTGALDLARTNARLNGVQDRLTFVRGDLFDSLDDDRFAAIVCNPPYIKSELIGGLEPEVRDWEPTAALDGGCDGLEIIRRVLQCAPAHLLDGGVLALEVGAGQAGALRRLCVANGLKYIETVCDLAGIERVVVFRCE